MSAQYFLSQVVPVAAQVFHKHFPELAGKAFLCESGYDSHGNPERFLARDIGLRRRRRSAGKIKAD